MDYNQPLVGGPSVHPTPAMRIGNLSLPGGSISKGIFGARARTPRPYRSRAPPARELRAATQRRAALSCAHGHSLHSPRLQGTPTRSRHAPRPTTRQVGGESTIAEHAAGPECAQGGGRVTIAPKVACNRRRAPNAANTPCRLWAQRRQPPRRTNSHTSNKSPPPRFLSLPGHSPAGLACTSNGPRTPPLPAHTAAA